MSDQPKIDATVVPADMDVFRRFEEVIKRYQMKPVATVYSEPNGTFMLIVLDKDCPPRIKSFLNGDGR